MIGKCSSPPVGEILDSHSFYWLVSACEGNRFHFNVWVHPDRVPAGGVIPTGINQNPWAHFRRPIDMIFQG